jgi:hypothetical protein
MAQEYEDFREILSLIPPRFLNPNGVHHISVDSQRINISQLRGWLADCDAYHGEECNSLLKVQSTNIAPSIALIDVQQLCLVAITTHVKYVALSYVWGQIAGTLMATTQNLKHLCIPGYLEIPETKSRIPRTILDAMAVSRMMGIDYLWVDRLCIVQDNSHHFNEQLQQMASIYANSCFTIIAADGQDANHGLRGIGGQALPRAYKQPFYEFSPTIKLLQTPDTESKMNPPSWYTRAWTFQERAVSRKTLVFINDTVYWQCRSRTWYEGVAVTQESGAWLRNEDPSRWPFHALRLYPWPDLQQYTDLVCGYNSRSLSFESDALKAFTAIINAMTGSFRNGFLFGIPEFFFDIGLLWTTHYPLKRRKCFPSWSWLGWSGEIDFVMEDAWRPEWWKSPPLDVFPIIEWRKMCNEGQSHVRIDNSYSIFKGLAHDSEAPLPEGWIRIGQKFLHPSIQGKNYSFPFPILTNLRTPSSEIWSPLLFFRTKKCTMFVGNSQEFKGFRQPAFGTCLVIELNDGSGVRSGLIESLFTTENDYARGDQCELIAISVASAKSKGLTRPYLFQEMDTFSEIKYLEPYDFYNVLWIEWQGGIAYRKALGRVFKDAWERQDLVETDIVLG